MPRVLLVSNDFVGDRMAGPGIRYAAFARQLASDFEVTLLIPNAPPVIDGVTVIQGSVRDARHLAHTHDVVVAQGGLDVVSMLILARRNVRTVYDLYVPFSESIAREGEVGIENVSGRTAREHRFRQNITLRCGDAFLTANEEQRHALLGALQGIGGGGVEDYRRDPTLRRVVSVVPFGIDEGPLPEGKRSLRGVVQGIGPDDFVVVWAGNVWDWFDPLTLIEAVGLLAGDGLPIRLVFMGVVHPNPAARRMRMLDCAVARAKAHGLLDTHVFFNYGWVPYDERASFLLDADVGASLHFASVEAEFSYRTRLLDHFWARLPTLATEGGSLSDFVNRFELGLTVKAGDVSAVANALRRLHDDKELRERISANLAAVRDQLTWSSASKPLIDLINSVENRRTAWPGRLLALAAYAGVRGQAVVRGGLDRRWLAPPDQ